MQTLTGIASYVDLATIGSDCTGIINSMKQLLVRITPAKHIVSVQFALNAKRDLPLFIRFCITVNSPKLGDVVIRVVRSHTKVHLTSAQAAADKTRGRAGSAD